MSLLLRRASGGSWLGIFAVPALLQVIGTASTVQSTWGLFPECRLDTLCYEGARRASAVYVTYMLQCADVQARLFSFDFRPC